MNVGLIVRMDMEKQIHSIPLRAELMMGLIRVNSLREIASVPFRGSTGKAPSNWSLVSGIELV